jgi:hypothetical protein
VQLQVLLPLGLCSYNRNHNLLYAQLLLQELAQRLLSN